MVASMAHRWARAVPGRAAAANVAAVFLLVVILHVLNMCLPFACVHCHMQCTYMLAHGTRHGNKIAAKIRTSPFARRQASASGLC